MNGNFLIPANSKNARLFFGMFTGFDLILFGSGLLVTIILVVILPIEQFMMSIISVIPACIAGLLVFPIPNYHNVITAIISMIRFITRRRTFIWKGWCARDEYK